MASIDPLSRDETRRLLDRCGSGDSGAWEDLRVRWTPLIAGLARRALGTTGGGSEADVDECVSETFARLLADGGARLRQYRTDFAPSTWLGFIVLGVVRDLRRERAGPPGERAPLESILAKELGPSEAVEDSEVQERLRLAIDALPDRDRLLLRMRYADGLDPARIGRILHLPGGAVSDALRRCRNRLKGKGMPESS